MKALSILVISALVLISNALPGAKGPRYLSRRALPEVFERSSTGPLVGPQSDSYNISGIKGSSIVEVDGTYHVFASTAKADGYNLVYFSFTDFKQAGSASFHCLDQSPIRHMLSRSISVFYFEPHNISDPAGWTAPTNFFSDTPSIVTDVFGDGYWVDMWVICGDSNCCLFSSDDNGHLYRAQTTLHAFPDDMDNTVIAMQYSDRYTLFEAANVYSTGDGQYLLLVEAIGSDSQRYFRSWTASSIPGNWTGLADTEENPFARSNNVHFNGTAWTTSISHGEMIRTQVDQTKTISPCNLRSLYQGMDPSATGEYNSLPWRLALLTRSTHPARFLSEGSSRL